MRLLVTMTLAMALLPAVANAQQTWNRNGVPLAASASSISSSEVTEGFRISPIPEAQLTFKKSARGKVGMGSYLVNSVGGCSGCHSYPQFLAAAPGDPFNGLPSAQTLKTITSANYNTAHFLAGGQCFGPFMARDITPDTTSKLPADLSETDFINMMRTGADLECTNDPTDPICAVEPPTPVLQVMPWPAYHNMTDTELNEVYSYLSALPHADPCNTPADGCPGFSGSAKTSTTYVYANTADCPNPALSQ